MNNTTLAHVGAELVVIAGVSFYFHHKTKTLQTEINNLKKDNKELYEIIDELEKGMNQLGQMVMRLQQNQQGIQKRPRPQEQTPFPQTPNPLPQQEPFQPPEQRSPPRREKKRPKKQKKRVEIESDYSSGDETLDDKDLDKELQGELSKIHQERKPKMVCNDDTCNLLDA